MINRILFNNPVNLVNPVKKIYLSSYQKSNQI